MEEISLEGGGVEKNKLDCGVVLNPNDASQQQDYKLHYKAKRRSGLVGVAMSLLSHVIFVLFAIYVTYICFEDYSLFSWHPICMTVGSLLLMAEAVMIMSQGNIIASNLSHQGRVRLHWILQAGAAAFIFAGFLVIVINKNLHNKNHFKSWHSVTGLVFLVFVGITSSGGVVTLYSFRLKQYVKPAKMKLFHNLLGVLTFVIGVVTEILGIYTHWFPKHASLSAQVVCTVFIVLGGIFTLESAVKSACARFKALKQSV